MNEEKIIQITSNYYQDKVDMLYALTNLGNIYVMPDASEIAKWKLLPPLPARK